MENKSIVLIGTFDTKSDEYLYLKDLIAKNNHKVITIDLGTGVGGQPTFIPDYPKEEVVKYAGTTMEELINIGKSGGENRVMEIMAEGAPWEVQADSDKMQRAHLEPTDAYRLFHKSGTHDPSHY